MDGRRMRLLNRSPDGRKEMEDYVTSAFSCLNMTHEFCLKSAFYFLCM